MNLLDKYKVTEVNTKDIYEQIDEVSSEYDTLVASLEHVMASSDSLVKAQETVLSLESIDDLDISMEGFIDKLKSMWKMAVAFVERIIKAIADFFSNIFGGIKRLKKSISKMADEIDELIKKGYSVPKGVTVKVPDPNTIKFNHSLDGVQIITGVSNLRQASEKVFEDYIPIGYSFLDNVSNVLEHAKNIFTHPDSINFVKEFSVFTKDARELTGFADKVSKLRLPGDKYIGLPDWNSVKNKDGESQLEIKHLIPELKDTTDNNLFDGDKNVEAPDLLTLSSFAREVTSLLDVVENKSKDLDKFNKEYKKVMNDELGDFVRAATHRKLIDKKEFAEYCTLINLTFVNLTGPTAIMVKMSWSVSRSITTLMERSIKMYEPTPYDIATKSNVPLLN